MIDNIDRELSNPRIMVLTSTTNEEAFNLQDAPPRQKKDSIDCNT